MIASKGSLWYEQLKNTARAFYRGAATTMPGPLRRGCQQGLSFTERGNRVLELPQARVPYD